MNGGVLVQSVQHIILVCRDHTVLRADGHSKHPLLDNARCNAKIKKFEHARKEPGALLAWLVESAGDKSVLSRVMDGSSLLLFSRKVAIDDDYSCARRSSSRTNIISATTLGANECIAMICR
jgi:hypothetical protein